MPSVRSDQDRFVRLFASAQSALTRFVCTHIGDVHRAEDLVQDVAARLW
jgi:DNA-directed RNA polymerase specialized sigma24 family protein